MARLWHPCKSWSVLCNTGTAFSLRYEIWWFNSTTEYRNSRPTHVVEVSNIFGKKKHYVTCHEKITWFKGVRLMLYVYTSLLFYSLSLSLSLYFQSKSHGSQNSGNGVPTPPHIPVPRHPKPISALTSGAWNRRYCSVQTYIIWPDLVNSFYAIDTAATTAVQRSPNFDRNFRARKNKIFEP